MDNSYSWIREKTVKILVDILEPATEEEIDIFYDAKEYLENDVIESNQQQIELSASCIKSDQTKEVKMIDSGDKKAEENFAKPYFIEMSTQTDDLSDLSETCQKCRKSTGNLNELFSNNNSVANGGLNTPVSTPKFKRSRSFMSLFKKKSGDKKSLSSISIFTPKTSKKLSAQKSEKEEDIISSSTFYGNGAQKSPKTFYGTSPKTFHDISSLQKETTIRDSYRKGLENPFHFRRKNLALPTTDLHESLV